MTAGKRKTRASADGVDPLGFPERLLARMDRLIKQHRKDVIPPTRQSIIDKALTESESPEDSPVEAVAAFFRRMDLRAAAKRYRQRRKSG